MTSGTLVHEPLVRDRHGYVWERVRCAPLRRPATLAAPHSSRTRPNEPGGEVSGGSFEDRAGTVPTSTGRRTILS
eukprot:12987567-Heterocapsa_arctica.AAC.1